ncbi:hypothetical protein AAMO2058_001095100, partial [Amorphochlora amoebiformis]
MPVEIDSDAKEDTKEVRVWVHKTSLDTAYDVLANPSYIPGVKIGSVLEISGSGSMKRHVGAGGEPLPSLYVQVDRVSDTNRSLQLSISKTVAGLHHFIKHGKKVKVSVLDKSSDSEKLGLDFLEVLYKDQYIGRAENWRLIAALQGEMVYKGKNIECEGMRTKVTQLMKQERRRLSGLVTSKTKIQFRSRSARLFWLIQLSAELWDFADDGEQYYEKMIIFLKILLDKWRSAGVSHALSVVLFGRTFYDLEPSSKRNWGTAQSAETANQSGKRCVDPSNVVQEDRYGRLYKDHYQVILEQVMDGNREDTQQALVLIRSTILDWPMTLKWGETDPRTGLVGSPSPSREGNVVESVNMVLTEFERHYYNRALKRTGQNIMVLTAGTGMFYVDRVLNQLTDVRMDDNGIIVDIVSVARPPLYRCVLFLTEGDSSANPNEKSMEDTTATHDFKAASDRKLKRARSTKTMSPRPRILSPLRKRAVNAFSTTMAPGGSNGESGGNALNTGNPVGGTEEMERTETNESVRAEMIKRRTRIAGSSPSRDSMGSSESDASQRSLLNWRWATNTLPSAASGEWNKAYHGSSSVFCFVPRWAAISFYDYHQYVDNGLFANPYRINEENLRSHKLPHPKFCRPASPSAPYRTIGGVRYPKPLPHSKGPKRSLGDFVTSPRHLRSSSRKFGIAKNQPQPSRLDETKMKQLHSKSSTISPAGTLARARTPPPFQGTQTTQSRRKFIPIPQCRIGEALKPRNYFLDSHLKRGREEDDGLRGIPSFLAPAELPVIRGYQDMVRFDDQIFSKRLARQLLVHRKAPPPPPPPKSMPPLPLLPLTPLMFSPPLQALASSPPQRSIISFPPPLLALSQQHRWLALSRVEDGRGAGRKSPEKTGDRLGEEGRERKSTMGERKRGCRRGSSVDAARRKIPLKGLLAPILPLPPPSSTQTKAGPQLSHHQAARLRGMKVFSLRDSPDSTATTLVIEGSSGGGLPRPVGGGGGIGGGAAVVMSPRGGRPLKHMKNVASATLRTSKSMRLLRNNGLSQVLRNSKPLSRSESANANLQYYNSAPNTPKGGPSMPTSVPPPLLATSGIGGTDSPSTNQLNWQPIGSSTQTRDRLFSAVIAGSGSGFRSRTQSYNSLTTLEQGASQGGAQSGSPNSPLPLPTGPTENIPGVGVGAGVGVGVGVGGSVGVGAGRGAGGERGGLFGGEDNPQKEMQ